MAGAPFKVKAVYEYSSPHDDDLSFPNGQVITVTEEEDADWYVGEYTDASGGQHSGLFPKNFVEKYEPEVPSRPTRASRPKSGIVSPPQTAVAADEPVAAQEGAPPLPTEAKPLPSAVAEPAVTSPKSPESTSFSPATQVKSPEPQAQATAPTAKPSPASASKPAPPPVSEKPSSFKDRIAAFNKSAAPPVAPFKPAAPPSGFIKKPFVAPPPSKNAYVPPPKAEPTYKVYRRDEDPEIAERVAEDHAAAESAGLASSQDAAETEEDKDVPKPQSLKERIALLQKQQMEQAARRSEAGTKEKPKKPVKKTTGDSERAAAENSNTLEDEHVQSGESLERPSEERPRESIERAAAPLPPAIPQSYDQDILSDSNDADQSAAGETTEDNEDTPEPEERPGAHKTMIGSQTIPRAPAAPRQEPDVGDEEDATEMEPEQEDDDDEEEEEDEMDAEARRRMEIRERMAKMSGGMGMAGMFGPPGGMPMQGAMPKKQQSTKSTKSTKTTTSGESGSTPASPPQARVPMFPIPGMQPSSGPRSEEPEPIVERQGEPQGTIRGEHDPLEMPDMEDIKPQRPSRSSMEQPLPPVPSSERGAPPPVPGGRPVPRPPPAESRPPPPPSQARLPQSPGPGYVSDDEMSINAVNSSAVTPGPETTLPVRGLPPPIPGGQTVPFRPQDTRSPPPPPPGARRQSYFGNDAASPTSPTTPGDSDKRASRIPPIPGATAMNSPPLQGRAPPPPPPSAAPVPVPLSSGVEEPDERESEYEGDYDTDIASSAKHKDALKSHAREQSLDDSTTADEMSLRSPVLPPTAPPPGPRAVPPPPPPSQAPPRNRASVDAPRAVPPPPPPARDVQPPQDDEDDEDDEFENYTRYHSSTRGAPPAPPPVPAPSQPAVQEPAQMHEESSDDLYSASPPRKSTDRGPPPRPAQAPPTPEVERSATFPPSQPAPGTTRPPQTRQSLDVRAPNTRRSMETSRPGNDGYIATDIDLAEQSGWWTKPDQPPPVFQNRSDILCEVEESSTSKRGGKTTISRDVYVLFLDYSQTVVTARFDSRDPADVSLEQRHEPPPQRLRQDQLEGYWQRFGARMAEAAGGMTGKKETVIGDGSPIALVRELLRPSNDALLPVGNRAYGALIYANLANASVQQFDEIRPGDIITLRNAKMQGKHGPMHAKYSLEAGSTASGGHGHVAVVADWDGTKKKVRAYEQGREKSKVRLESFRLGDLKSGEVRVWRVVGRDWVGWSA